MASRGLDPNIQKTCDEWEHCCWSPFVPDHQVWCRTLRSEGFSHEPGSLVGAVEHLR